MLVVSFQSLRVLRYTALGTLDSIYGTVSRNLYSTYLPQLQEISRTKAQKRSPCPKATKSWPAFNDVNTQHGHIRSLATELKPNSLSLGDSKDLDTERADTRRARRQRPGSNARASAPPVPSA